MTTQRLLSISLVSSAATFVLAPFASSQQLTYGGDVDFRTTPPTSVASNSLDTTAIVVFQEKSDVLLQGAVPVDIDEPGDYLTGPGQGGAISSGTRVDTYFFHQKTTSFIEMDGWVEFPGEVLGILVTADRLNATDVPFGSDVTQYPGGDGRALEFPADYLTLDPNGRRIDVHFYTGGVVDQIRVFVRSAGDTSHFEPYCFGQSGCPCMNDVGPGVGTGCANSTNAGGRIHGTGSNDITADDMAIHLEGLPASRWTILFMGSRRATPLQLGDGLLCVMPGPLGTPPGTGYRRFPVRRANLAGELTYDSFVSFANAHLGAGGAVITAGSTWSLQAIYRDPEMNCTGFNQTNALTVSF